MASKFFFLLSKLLFCLCVQKCASFNEKFQYWVHLATKQQMMKTQTLTKTILGKNMILKDISRPDYSKSIEKRNSYSCYDTSGQKYETSVQGSMIFVRCLEDNRLQSEPLSELPNKQIGLGSATSTDDPIEKQMAIKEMKEIKNKIMYELFPKTSPTFPDEKEFQEGKKKMEAEIDGRMNFSVGLKDEIDKFMETYLCEDHNLKTFSKEHGHTKIINHDSLIDDCDPLTQLNLTKMLDDNQGIISKKTNYKSKQFPHKFPELMEKPQDEIKKNAPKTFNRTPWTHVAEDHFVEEAASRVICAFLSLDFTASFRAQDEAIKKDEFRDVAMWSLGKHSQKLLIEYIVPKTWGTLEKRNEDKETNETIGLQVTTEVFFPYTCTVSIDCGLMSTVLYISATPLDEMSSHVTLSGFKNYSLDNKGHISTEDDRIELSMLLQATWIALQDRLERGEKENSNGNDFQRFSGTLSSKHCFSLNSQHRRGLLDESFLPDRYMEIVLQRCFL